MICKFHAFMTLVVFAHFKFIISISPLFDFKDPKCRNYIIISQPFKGLLSHLFKNYFNSDDKVEATMQMYLFFHVDINEQVVLVTT